METIFQLSNLLVMPFWLLMVFLPQWGWTRRIVSSLWVVVPAATLYVVLVVPNLLTLLPLLANPQLATIAELLGTPAGATIAWAHFLAFDLFVGRWAYLDSHQRTMTAWLASPALLLILMVGPLGLLFYLALRTVTQRRAQPVSAAGATPPALSSPTNGLRRAWAFNRPLTATILINLALVPVLVAAMLLDPQVITGVNGWLKPLKFAWSIAIYAATFLWLLTLVQGRRRWVQLAANVAAVGLTVEIVLITLQVMRGTTSHFNVSSPLDAAIFATMGVFISAVAVMNLLLAFWLLLQRMPDPVIAWGLRLGVLLSLVGIAVGIFMTATGPTPAQMAALQAGGALTVVGAHSVGVPDGGPGLPFLGWSTTGGDLRAGHFIGLHAMQVLPLIAFLLTRPLAKRRLSTRQRVGMVWTAGISYLGLTALVIGQALRGQPLLAPDGATLAVAGFWLGATLFAVAAILLANRRRTFALRADSPAVRA